MKNKWIIDAIRITDPDKVPVKGTADCQDGEDNCRIHFRYDHRSAVWNFHLGDNTDPQTRLRLLKHFGVDREEDDLNPKSFLCMQIVESVVEAHPNFFLPQREDVSPGSQVCDAINRFCERVNLDCRAGEVESNFMDWRHRDPSDQPDCFVITAYLFGPRRDLGGLVRGMAFMTDRDHAEIIITMDIAFALTKVERTNSIVDWGDGVDLPSGIYATLARRMVKLLNRY